MIISLKSLRMKLLHPTGFCTLRAKVNNDFRLLQEFSNMGMPYARRIEGRLWELPLATTA